MDRSKQLAVPLFGNNFSFAAQFRLIGMHMSMWDIGDYVRLRDGTKVELKKHGAVITVLGEQLRKAGTIVQDKVLS